MQRTVWCATLDEAKGFVAGIEFVNDSAITVTGIEPAKTTDGYVVILADEDLDGND